MKCILILDIISRVIGSEFFHIFLYPTSTSMLFLTCFVKYTQNNNINKHTHIISILTPTRSHTRTHTKHTHKTDCYPAHTDAGLYGTIHY